jgi:hypothetical protein
VDEIMAEDRGASSKRITLVLVAVILIVGVAVALVTYFYSTLGTEAAIQEKQLRINSLEEELGNTNLEVERLNRIIEIGEVKGDDGPIEGDEVNCLVCHDQIQTKSWHIPEKIMNIEKDHGIRRRVCIDCHGPNGPPWSSDEQMTDFELIDFDPNAGENGKFILTDQIPHSIHKRKLDAGTLSCQFCHVPPGTIDFVIPEVKTELGRVLYCQNEGCHDNEGGNYIAIHVELRPFFCTTCHTGELIEIHQRGTAKLGKFEQINGTLTHVH